MGWGYGGPSTGKSSNSSSSSKGAGGACWSLRALPLGGSEVVVGLVEEGAEGAADIVVLIVLVMSDVSDGDKVEAVVSEEMGVGVDGGLGGGR